ncbi:glycoside hydrolase [Mycena floridula]|nr:glycoside hydrolase [Mycena floridula]
MVSVANNLGQNKASDLAETSYSDQLRYTWNSSECRYCDIRFDRIPKYSWLWGNNEQFSSTYSEQSEDNYRALLAYTFDMTDGANAAGLSYLRVPIGASNSSSQGYSSDDTSGDTSFSSFNIDAAPSYLFSVINVIRSIKSDLEPAWMKDSGIMNGGSLKSNLISASVEGQIGAGLRTLRNNNGLSSAKVMGYEVDAATYPVRLMQDAGNSFASVAFHCYKGSVANQDSFHSAFSSNASHHCTGDIFHRMRQDNRIGFWSNIKVPDAIPDSSEASNMSRNLQVCKDGCRGIVTVSSDGSYSWNQLVNGSGYLSRDHLAGRLESWKILSEGPDRLNSLQAMYKFRVGVTTLWWWFAPVNVNGERKWDSSMGLKELGP